MCDRSSGDLMGAKRFRCAGPVMQRRLNDNNGVPDNRDGDADGVDLIREADGERRIGSFDLYEPRPATGVAELTGSARGCRLGVGECPRCGPVIFVAKELEIDALLTCIRHEAARRTARRLADRKRAGPVTAELAGTSS